MSMNIHCTSYVDKIVNISINKAPYYTDIFFIAKLAIDLSEIGIRQCSITIVGSGVIVNNLKVCFFLSFRTIAFVI